MAIVMHYDCSECEAALPTLDAAQDHANATQHRVDISGTLTTNKAIADLVSLEEAQRKRAFEAEVLRRARDKDLLAR